MLGEISTSIALLAFVPVTVKYISANTYTIGIVRLGFATLCAFSLFKNKSHLRLIPPADWWILVSLGAFFAIHWLTFFLSIKISSASIAAIGLYTYGIHLIFLGSVFRKTTIKVTDILAIILAVFGCVIVVPEFTLKNSTTLGLCMSILSGFFYACLPIIHQKNPQIPIPVRALGQFLFAFIFFLAFYPLTDWHLSVNDWGGLIFLAVACTFVAHTLWVRVTTELSTVTISIFSYMVVPIALILSYLLLDEPMGRDKLVGAAIIIFANLVGLSSQWKRKAFRAHI